jgi:multisubunit Na+/H+ antiporter MnhB subunit
MSAKEHEPPGRPPARLSGEEQDYAIKTWRYLRLAMVVLVVGLGVSVAYERSKVNCFQDSISAYYYTPAHGFLIGALVSVGVCLFSLKGSTEHEDILLNLAGMFAPVVALVPIASTGSCASVIGTAKDRDVNIANNVTALIVVGAIGLIILAVLAVRNRPSRAARAGYAIAAATWIATALVFWLARRTFVDYAHYVAAVLMFVCILAVAWINALEYPKTRAASPRNPYTAVGSAMFASTVVLLIAALLGWDYWLLAIETVLIGLFAVFWVIQTMELWRKGIR